MTSAKIISRLTGATKVNRLIRIKNANDPANLFRWKQSIPLDKHHLPDSPACS
jgi:hypothetical protein